MLFTQDDTIPLPAMIEEEEVAEGDYLVLLEDAQGETEGAARHAKTILSHTFLVLHCNSRM